MGRFVNSSVEIVNWYSVFLAKVISVVRPDLPEHYVLERAEIWAPVLASITAILLIVVIAKCAGYKKLKPELMSDEDLMPPKKFGFAAFLELSWAVIQSTLESTLGDRKWERFAPVLGGTFFILLLSGLSGVIPGFEPAASSMSFTFAAAMTVFLYSLYYGLKEAGFDFIKHMAGPIVWVAPFIFVIEFVSMLSRPVSLSLRIFGNLSGDHFVFALFSGLMDSMLVPFLPIPAIFLAFGAFVACVQAFIFMTLGAVYIKLGLDSKEHH